MYVFLRQEVERRSGDTVLADAVVDALIVWALEGTSPDTDILMSRNEVRDKILTEIPTAKQLVDELLDGRMESLANKGNKSGREVRWYRKRDAFCLPYETRRLVELENSDDELVKIRALESIRGRIVDVSGQELTPDEIDQCVAVADRAVQIAFEREGLEFSYFLQQSQADTDYPTISDCIAASLDEARVDPKRRLVYGDAAFRAVRSSMYYSRPEERDYFGRLSRTYGLLFTLNCEPRLIEYFQEMAADFHLYVGSDVLVRALSERHLPREDQMTRNMLAMARAAGAVLVLAAPVLAEVVAHLRATDMEFRNWFSASEQHVTMGLARNAPKILVRSYFYAKLEPALHEQVPASWDRYMSQFCEYPDLHRARGVESVRRYLQAQFGMQFESIEDVRSLANASEVQQLAGALEEIKTSRNLASNDALMTLAVYGLRAKNREDSQVSEFGYRTWWLTDEARILRYTKALIEAHAGVRYMMRPDFLLNFFALAPSVADVRRAYANVFPTLLGVRLARRMDEGAFREMMQKVRGWDEWEDGRRAAAVAELSDRLKGDFSRQYLTQFDRSER
ncbi:MAG: hypothetical protein M3256_19075 [Actinomycetota bacterium]|nr:hypothetical protein [Actinomycetota bacterium]